MLTSYHTPNDIDEDFPAEFRLYCLYALDAPIIDEYAFRPRSDYYASLTIFYSSSFFFIIATLFIHFFRRFILHYFFIRHSFRHAMLCFSYHLLRHLEVLSSSIAARFFAPYMVYCIDAAAVIICHYAQHASASCYRFFIDADFEFA